VAEPPTATAAPFSINLARQLLQALGGTQNVREIGAASTRLLVSVRNASSIDESALRSLGLRGVARPGGDTVHIVIGPGADAARAALQGLA
jgi:PTS system N-acetylglucosamine-specific IIC component